LIGVWLAGASLASVVFVDFVLLLFPTTLMGMTLPLMCRIVIGQDQAIGRHLSWLYGVNTLGAALGALLSAYLLIGLFGLDGATYLAAVLNFVLAIAVYRMTAASHVTAEQAATVVPASVQDSSLVSNAALPYRWVLVFSFLSGFTALGYEIVWYRVLGVILHGTVYVFGTILFFYLAGVALGSLWARSRIDKGGCIDRFAMCQLGISAYSFVIFVMIGNFSWIPPIRQLIAASFFTTFHPAPELIAGHADIYSWYSLLDIGGWALLILGVPTLLMGYGFANLMREGAQRVDTLGDTVGKFYTANIAGSTLGSLAAGFVLIHYLGSEQTLRVLIVLGCLVPIVLLVTARERAARESFGLSSHRKGWLLAASVLIVGAMLASPGRGDIIRAVHVADFDAVDFASAEDRTGVSALRTQHEVVAFVQEKAILGEQRLYIDGSHHGNAATADTGDDGVAVALAAHRAPRRVLSIGLGDGQMAATAVANEEVRELVVVELNSTLEKVLRETTQGKAVVTSSKTRYIVDDGRRWLQANPSEKFDVIMMFPLHAAHAYSGNLYSMEFFTTLKNHLAPGGLLLSRTVDLYATARTVATVFPFVFRLDESVYLASAEPVHLDRHRLGWSAEDVGRRIVADRETILANTSAARINTDLRPNSEFYVTYPFASVLQTRFRDATPYRAQDDRHVRQLLRTDDRPPLSETTSQP